jgi:hypothetical protein
MMNGTSSSSCNVVVVVADADADDGDDGGRVVDSRNRRASSKTADDMQKSKLKSDFSVIHPQSCRRHT